MYLQYAPHVILFIVFVFALSIYLSSTWLYVLSIIILCFILYFYRPFMGKYRVDPKQILSPAQGRILDVIYHQDKKKHQIAIFLSPLNVHIQYAPCDGMITKQVYKPGEFQPAYLLEKSQYNERMITEMENVHGKVWVVQIAGLLARRITPFYSPNKLLAQGEPLGMIHFGSRVDVWVDATEATPLVLRDQVIEIGQPLAEWVEPHLEQSSL